MNREIKFRAWYHIGVDKTLGEMQYSPRFIEDKWMVKDTDGEWKESNCVELMQYTGLKDKQGKEIYEGDILKANWGRGEIITVVIYEDAAFVLTIPNDPDYRDMVGEENNKCMEVIGNIYEGLYNGEKGVT
jgi:uncharacterized phage protein (TIGR01671 family)